MAPVHGLGQKQGFLLEHPNLSPDNMPTIGKISAIRKKSRYVDI